MDALKVFRALLGQKLVTIDKSSKKAFVDALNTFLNIEYEDIPEVFREKFIDKRDRIKKIMGNKNLSDELSIEEATKGMIERILEEGGPTNPVYLYFGGLITENKYETIYAKRSSQEIRDLMINTKVSDTNICLGEILIHLLSNSLKFWKDKGKYYCISIMNKEEGFFNKNYTPLLYCLIEGKPDDLENTNIYIKDITIPCEIPTIKELINYYERGIWEKEDYLISEALKIINNEAKDKSRINKSKKDLIEENNALTIINKDSISRILKEIFKNKSGFEIKSNKIKKSKMYILNFAFEEIRNPEELGDGFFPTMHNYPICLIHGGSYLSYCINYLFSKAQVSPQGKHKGFYARIRISELESPVKEDFIEEIKKV